MENIQSVVANKANSEFNWALYEDGFNGSGLKVNKKVKTADKKTHVFCHEDYAQDLYDAYEGVFKDYGDDFTTEVRANDLVAIDDMTLINDDEMLISVNHGSSNIVVDLTKEDAFYKNILRNSDGSYVSKEAFVANMKQPEFKNRLLSIGLSAKVNAHKNKASLWDGFVESISIEMKEQITKNEKAYIAHIDSANGGGYMVTVSGCIKAFMPGSMAAINRITDFESLLGKDLEVMVEKYDPKFGFIVSHKKYLKTIIPIKLNNLEKDLEKEPDKKFRGVVTGTTMFGIFVELDNVLTGMIHKTLISDELYERFMNKEDLTGEELEVYVHSIDNGRIILSDVDSEHRAAVIEKRTNEKEQKRAKKENANE